MQQSILGKLWKLAFVTIPRRKGKDGKVTVGDCDIDAATIRIDKRLEGKRRLEVIIHECTHAAGWHIDEEFVEQFGKDVADLLWALGYREQGQ